MSVLKMNRFHFLLVPGLGNSGEDHWQTLWARTWKNAECVEQDNWDHPDLENWLLRLQGQITRQSTPVVLVAHSLSVSLVVHWAQRYRADNLKGAMLVAPADVESPDHTPDVVRSFAPVPLAALPFDSVVVASENDTFVSIDRAKSFARLWGSEFVNIGNQGHINADSKLGIWEQGLNILEELADRLSSSET